MAAVPAWYAERKEPEETFVGILRGRETAASPMGRTRLPFELALPDAESLPIYGPDAEAALSRLVGRRLRITGRVVDLSSEGFGRELWLPNAEAARVATDDAYVREG
ncbi:MAG: hypothetical protein M3301_10245 [Chloroflexota bacterium]|nr:hypothetical protein [Chloroflexota bacterium]